MEFPAVVDPQSGGMDAGFVYRLYIHMSAGDAPRPNFYDLLLFSISWDNLTI
jgi:hypothetical protein